MTPGRPYGQNQVIADGRVLREHFIPKQIAHRDGQLKTVRDCLQPLTQGKSMRNAFLHGPPGAGKTCISRYVCDELVAHAPGIEYVYVNVWKNPTRFKILLKILNELGVVLSVHRKGTPTDELLEKLERKLDGPLVVILDEIDRAEDPDVLYDLLEMGAGMILIANDSAALHDVDARIRSRFSSAEQIEFPRYTQSEITDILEDRADWGLVPGAVRRARLETISENSEGDARIAIDTLRVAAELAENDGSEEITEEHIEGALPKANDLSDERLMDTLNEHQRVLYQIIRGEGEIEPSDLYERYEEEVSKDPVVKRTLRKYLERLVKADLIEAEGEGRWRKYRKA